jgi:hypothetical protein
MSTDDSSGQLTETETWPELAIGLYERLTGRGAEITYEFKDMEVDVPDRIGDDADHAQWRLNGTVKIRARERDSEK